MKEDIKNVYYDGCIWGTESLAYQLRIMLLNGKSITLQELDKITTTIIDQFNEARTGEQE